MYIYGKNVAKQMIEDHLKIKIGSKHKHKPVFAAEALYFFALPPQSCSSSHSHAVAATVMR